MPDIAATMIPIEATPQAEYSQAPQQQNPVNLNNPEVVSYVTTWRNQLRNARSSKLDTWNECWQLYRGVEDFTDKDEWQSKISLPKPWAVVKQATSTIKRLLTSNNKPWALEPYNPDDLVAQTRCEKMTRLNKVFLDKADFLPAFAEGLECGFIMGVGIWKLWWGLTPRMSTKVETVPMPMQGESEGVPGYPGMQRQVVQEESLEGRLFIKAVDPYKFFWLPGSKLNQWVGTIEDIEVPKWKLTELAEAGVFDAALVAALAPMKLDEQERQSALRFNERPSTPQGPSSETGMVKLTEFYGPIVIGGKLVERNGHVIIANDNVILLAQPNKFWHKKPPYIGYTPLAVPFRTEGVGLIEMTRAINKAMSRLANMSVDTLAFRLLPLMEVVVDAYENPEDLETGIIPGKLLRRNMSYPSQSQGITPIQFEDISQGSIAVASQLDRAAQEGALVSEIQQGLPRFRGLQSATEIELKQQNQDTFFGAMASDIEQSAIKPMIEMANDLIFQFIDTATDPRVASILGVDAAVLQGIPKEELIDMIAGDYSIKVTGITDQLEKAEMLQNLVQFMNIIGQNAEAWMPYLNSDALLRRIMESFRPAIRDIEQIIADPQTVEANKMAYQQAQMMPNVVSMVPNMMQQDQQAQQAGQQNQMQMMQMIMDNVKHEREMNMREKEINARPKSTGG